VKHLVLEKKTLKLRVYNLSKTARDELIQSIDNLLGGRKVKLHDLKVAESDDPNYSVVFDAEQKFYLGRTKNPPASFPLLKDQLLLKDLPVIIVDSGAIKFVCNGANIMRPGIVKIEGVFAAQDIVLVKEEKYGKPIAVGRSMVSSQDMASATKGAVVTNLHYVGDKFWDTLKELDT
jgi:malignant T-cell-amplified sequence